MALVFRKHKFIVIGCLLVFLLVVAASLAVYGVFRTTQQSEGVTLVDETEVSEAGAEAEHPAADSDAKEEGVTRQDGSDLRVPGESTTPTQKQIEARQVLEGCIATSSCEGSQGLAPSPVTPPTPVDTSGPVIAAQSLVFVGGATVGIKVTTSSEVTWSVARTEAGVVASGKTLPGSNGVATISPTSLQMGHYTLNLSNKIGKSAGVSFVIVGAQLPKQNYYATNVAYGQMGEATRANAGMTATYPEMAKIGFSSVRGSAAWMGVETTKGVLALPGFATEYITRTNQLNMNLLFMAGYGNALYNTTVQNKALGGSSYKIPPQTAQARTAYAQHIVHILDANPSIQQVEVWNEWDIYVPEGYCATGACYYTLFKATYDIVKAKHPNVKLIAGAHSGKPTHLIAWFEDFMKAGGMQYADMLSWHAYGANTESFITRNDMLNDLMRRYNGGKVKPVIISETGFSTTTNTATTTRVPDGISQAAGLLQTYTVFQRYSNVQGVAWYTAINGSRDPNDIVGNYGLFKLPDGNVLAYQPKASVATLYYMRALLNGFSFVDQKTVAGDVAVYTFKNQEQRVIRIAWRKGDVVRVGTPATVTLPASTQFSTYVTSTTGATIKKAVAPSGNSPTVTITVTSRPQFIIER